MAKVKPRNTYTFIDTNSAKDVELAIQKIIVERLLSLKIHETLSKVS